MGVRDVFDKNFNEIFFSQIVSIIGGLIAGTILAVYTDRLLLLPGMFILLPGFLEMRGNISGSMAARITSGLFLGMIKAKGHSTKAKVVRGNAFAAFLLALLISAILGIIAFAFNYLFFHQITPKIILIPLLGGIISNAIEIPLTLFFTFYLFRKGHDPNNIMGPFVTSTGDITSVISLLIAMLIV